jgi:hypothetical protein
MPVLEHEVHPSTIVGEGHRYGCWNLPESLDHDMSDRCRFDISLRDPSCEGCVHRGKGEKYNQLIRSKGK